MSPWKLKVLSLECCEDLGLHSNSGSIPWVLTEWDTAPSPWPFPTLGPTPALLCADSRYLNTCKSTQCELGWGSHQAQPLCQSLPRLARKGLSCGQTVMKGSQQLPHLSALLYLPEAFLPHCVEIH